MKIAIIGGGAMGSLFGAMIAPLTTVWLISGWIEHVSAIQQSGLRLIKLDGNETTVPVQALSDPDPIANLMDVALIAVKSPDTARATQIADNVLKPDGLALSMQNGFGNTETMAAILGSHRVVQGVTSHGATLQGPGCIRHAGIGPTHLATRPDINHMIKLIAKLFTQAGFETHLSNDLNSLIWGKLIVNVGVNALTAILRVSNGVLAESEPIDKIVSAAVDEAVNVADALGVTLPYDDAQAQTRRIMSATYTNRSSMLADVLRGVPTEIDSINGVIVQQGQRLGIETPANEMLVWLIKGIEATYSTRVT